MGLGVRRWDGVGVREPHRPCMLTRLWNSGIPEKLFFGLTCMKS